MPIVTMADVAREAKVSATTVARAIYNNGYVSENKRQQILAVAKELGYVPNKLARGLKNQSSYIIGNIMPFSSTNPFFQQLAESLAVEAERSDYHVVSVFSNGEASQEREVLEGMVGLSVDAVIFTANGQSRDNINWLQKLDIPVVMIERTMSIPGIDKVIIDNFEGSYLATQHILEQGHTKIGFIGCRGEDSVEQQRLAGYRQAMKDAGLTPMPEWEALFDDYQIRFGYDGSRLLMTGSHAPTAIFAASDIYACGVLKYAQENGLSIPDDLSVVGYDNTLSDFFAPSLTTVGTPVQDIGKAAIRLAMERIQQVRKVGETICYSTYLIDRGTVRKL